MNAIIIRALLQRAVEFPGRKMGCCINKEMLIGTEVQQHQIPSRLQSFYTSYAAAIGVRIRQAKRVFLSQWFGWLLQGVADGGDQVGIGVGDLLRRGGVQDAD
jgi:hypothetical protein